MTNLGLIHVYTGDGKGKTTAAIGLSLRAAEYGFRIAIFQFMKAYVTESGEIKAIKRFPNVSVKRYGANLLAKDHPPVDEIKKEIADGLKEALEISKKRSCDFLILDEINTALSVGLAELDEVKKLIDLCKGSIEIVMTGRGVPQQIINLADYVTEFRAIKHPFGSGISARRGVEF